MDISHSFNQHLFSTYCFKYCNTGLNEDNIYFHRLKFYIWFHNYHWDIIFGIYKFSLLFLHVRHGKSPKFKKKKKFGWVE